MGQQQDPGCLHQEVGNFSFDLEDVPCFLVPIHEERLPDSGENSHRITRRGITGPGDDAFDGS